jgi:hypothetical protein
MKDIRLESLKETYAKISEEQAIPMDIADREALEIIKLGGDIEDVNPYLVKLHRYASPKVKKQIEALLAADPVSGTGNWMDRGFDKVDRFLDKWL